MAPIKAKTSKPLRKYPRLQINTQLAQTCLTPNEPRAPTRPTMPCIHIRPTTPKPPPAPWIAPWKPAARYVPANAVIIGAPPKAVPWRTATAPANAAEAEATLAATPAPAVPEAK
ncbi:hypothetical protein CC85DRAFT_299828 [Cutaneotrichosporon oleaginosum]|uniref:Uncharacterized protein n=1 Tax=Cutaneotrichosporon oleaginosum TaxID=879819 RepID=A0A0J0XWB0_9TREE|nr:uncharacterized protein CC85DRAFT_299828 [Cutaneotrichosporon oleaginosum]KLT45372.1 hypothetical protein CC85DRAFT_299828 [Cutaneotrichosporon oleaginosum]TXT14804.1 hypothetical protein COLE_00997 [Cutaneotrichosporon oleaginosum]